MGSNTPIRIACSFNNLWQQWFARPPHPHRTVINSKSPEDNFSGRVARITMCSDDLKNGSTTRLVVAMQYVLHGAPGGCVVINLVVFNGV